ncbi:MAG: nuclear transport factor 2 family protein [Candidatus Promineifilaceae bacterium]|nr:nuclear transport factor 2 family protein [Candidatus Promineifilaceae bacterium]
MKNEQEADIWQFLHKHLTSIFTEDAQTYRETTSEELSLYEWFVTPHRQDGLDFHFFMIDHSWAGSGDYRYDLLEPRLQLYGDTAVVSYTFMLTRANEDGQLTHRTHNESRVLVKDEAGWQVVHVHKSPAWQAPFGPETSAH